MKYFFVFENFKIYNIDNLILSDSNIDNLKNIQNIKYLKLNFCNNIKKINHINNIKKIDLSNSMNFSGFFIKNKNNSLQELNLSNILNIRYKLSDYLDIRLFPCLKKLNLSNY